MAAGSIATVPPLDIANLLADHPSELNQEASPRKVMQKSLDGDPLCFELPCETGCQATLRAVRPLRNYQTFADIINPGIAQLKQSPASRSVHKNMSLIKRPCHDKQEAAEFSHLKGKSFLRQSRRPRVPSRQSNKFVTSQASNCVSNVRAGKLASKAVAMRVPSSQCVALLGESVSKKNQRQAGHLKPVPKTSSLVRHTGLYTQATIATSGFPTNVYLEQTGPVSKSTHFVAICSSIFVIVGPSYKYLPPPPQSNGPLKRPN